MCFARRISTILLAGAIAAPVVLTVPAKGAQPERKAQKKSVRRAQAENRVPERPAAMLERMKQQILALDLSADQKKQIEDLFAKAQDDLAADRKDAAAEKDAAKFREKAQSTVRELRQKVVSLLNEEQRQALRKKFQAAQANALEGGEQMAARVKEALKSVELTDEQKHKLDALLAESQRKAKELTQRTQAEMRELMQETRAKVEALLTPEQREKMKQSRPQGKSGNGQGEQSKPKPNAPDDRL